MLEWYPSLILVPESTVGTDVNVVQVLAIVDLTSICFDWDDLAGSY